MMFEHFGLKHWAWNQYHVMEMNRLQMKKSYWNTWRKHFTVILIIGNVCTHF